jgi:uncharacterized protein YydD (DUF2326 family)
MIKIYREYIKELDDIYKTRESLKNSYLTKSTDLLRQNYKNYINEVGLSLGRLNNTKEALTKYNELTQQGFEIEQKTRKIDKEIVDILNSSRVGTLQGLARQTIKENNIEPNKDDVVAQAVLEQPYDERADINRNTITGGRKRKTNQKRRKKNKKSRKNKYKY